MSLRRHEDEAGNLLDAIAYQTDHGKIATIARLIATAEARGRERAAKVCDQTPHYMARNCAAAIRAYTETEEAEEAGGGR